jgi:hypothetical protein
MDGMTARSGTKSRLGLPGMRDNKPRTNTFMAAPRRRCRALANRRMARGMRLVSITCMAASGIADTMAFDSDSKQVAIENCSSRSLTTSRRDFVPGTIQKCNVAVSGLGGQIKCKIKGTVCWTFDDDQGRPHDFLLPTTPMCEALPHRLLSPQHWAQEVERGDQAPLIRNPTTRMHD